MSRSSVLASLASQDVSASEFDKLDADNGSDHQSQVDLKSPLASPTFTGSITTPEIRSGATLTIDPATVGDNTGLVLLKGNLQVDGTSTTINSTTLTVDDLNLTLASGAADSAAANGAGITIDGASATMTYTHSTTSFDFNKPVNVTGNASVTGDLTVDTNTLKVDSSNNRVGIGTSSVDALLHIESTSTPVFQIETTGTVDRKWHLQVVEADGRFLIRDDTAGSNPFNITTSGNVGIGTTAPVAPMQIDSNSAGDAPLLRLQNRNNTDGDTANILFGFAGNNNANKGGIFFKRTASYGRGSLIFATENSASNDNVDNSDAKLTIDSSGNVGIGTASPVTSWGSGKAVLALKGASGDNYSVLELYNHTTDANNDNLGIIDFGDGSNKNASIRVARESAVNDAYMTFWTNNQGSITERVRISAVGNVGIGTSSPVGDLHISESGATEVRLQMTNSNTGHAGSDGMALVLSADGLHRYLWNYENQTFHIGTNNVTQMQFASYDVTDGHKACRVSLGYGALDDLLSCGLQVNSHRYYTQGAVFKDRDGSTSYAGTLLQFYRQSTSVGSITTSGSATAFNTSSDYRLKYDIKDMGSGLNIINDLKPRTFKWLVNKDTKRDDGTKFNNPDTYGFIAHEVEEAIPRANDIGFVQGEKDGEGYQSVDYTKFSPIIIKAIQELSAKVTALENAS